MELNGTLEVVQPAAQRFEYIWYFEYWKIQYQNISSSAVNA